MRYIPIDEGIRTSSWISTAKSGKSCKLPLRRRMALPSVLTGSAVGFVLLCLLGAMLLRSVAGVVVLVAKWWYSVDRAALVGRRTLGNDPI